MQRRYQGEIQRNLRYEDEQDTQSIEEEWERIVRAISKSSRKAIPLKKKPKCNKGWDADCEKEAEKKGILRLKALQTEAEQLVIAYRNQRKKTKMLYRQKRRNYEEQKMHKMQEYYRRKEMRNFYKVVNKGKRAREVNLIKGMDGALIGDETGIRERWMEHFKHILNEDDDEGLRA